MIGTVGNYDNLDILTMLPDMTQIQRITANWHALAARADHFFDQVLASQRPHMQCGPGCDACCRQDLALCTLEALALLAGLEQLPVKQRTALADAAAHGASPCPLLREDGRCHLYQHRPIICRTHGLPILYQEQGAEQSSLSVCHLNFTGTDPPAGAVLNGGVLSAGLAVADALARQELGLSPGEDRITVSALVAHGWSSFPGTPPS